ncbi:MAG: serine/threonine protein kinase [Myxococcales bacterium]|nr:serine/threonine protein kinase [Myxococcales bacterium]
MDGNDSTHPLIGRVLGNSYRIVRCMAEGGMASVFEAEHVRLKRPIAVKVIAQHLAGDADAALRFQREAETISQLHHPNIVQVTDFDATPEGELYLVMELLQGESLATLLAREGTLEFNQVVLIVWQIASALAEAHAKGLIHRDLTPANVFITTRPGQPLFVKLLDFGISRAVVGGRKITRQFEVVGTAQFMAPEQAIGGEIGTAVDQFALACVVYRSLTGKLPFVGKSPTETLQSVAFSHPVPLRQLRPTLPAGIDAVMARAMSKSAAERYPHVSDFAVALTRAADANMEVSFSSAPPPLVNTAGAQPLAIALLDPLRPVGGDAVTMRHMPEPSMLAESVAAAERALLQGDIGAARGLCAVAESHADMGAGGELAQRLEAVYEGLLGGTERAVKVVEDTKDGLSPRQAFLLSRIESGSVVEDLLDISHLPRRETLSLLVALTDAGHIRLS